MSDNVLPSFQKPPVVERVLGVQFDPLPNFTNAHLGAFWSALGSDWPNVTDAPPLPQESERFGDERVWEQLGLMRFWFSGTPEARVQIRNRANDRMLQLQNGRFHYNWLGRGGGEKYTRYETIRPEFDSMLDELLAFLANSRLNVPRMNQWEITYVNHLPKGTVWNAPENWNEVFISPVALPLILPEVALESFSAQWHYEIAPKRGRLHVEIQHGREELQGRQPQEILLFKLTARGIIDDEKGWTLDSGINLGHHTIVSSFARLTSQAARDFWEEQR